MKRKHACVRALWYIIVGREGKKRERGDGHSESSICNRAMR